MSLTAANWNKIADPLDKEVWDRLTANFWLPEKVPVANDVKSWNTLTEEEKTATDKVFAGLTILDTLQSEVGALVLHEDAEDHIEKAVFSNIQFMEAFSGETELLTPSGWKKIKEVTTEDKVCQFDPETKELSFTKPVIVPSHFAEEVYEIVAKNGNARQVVSGGHRVYLEEKEKKNSSCKNWVPRFVEARDLSGVNLKSAFRKFRSTGRLPEGEGLTATDRILIALQADGSFSGDTWRYTGEKSGTIPVSFSFAKNRKIERLISLAESAGMNLREKSSRVNQRAFTLDLPVELAHSRKKLFEEWFDLEKVSGTWCREFIDELAKWDSYEPNSQSYATYYTASKKNSDFVVAVASLAGYRSRTTIRHDSRSDKFNDSYVTNITKLRDCVNAQSMSVNRVEAREVYCVQVPTTALLTRNGESPVISGNCVHAKSYSNIFSTLRSSDHINELFDWVNTDPHIRFKIDKVQAFYQHNSELCSEEYSKALRKAASVILESFLFYSGFYLPMKFASLGKLTNTADIIRLIMRDEGVHGFYIGYKFQQARQKLSEAEVEKLDKAIEILLKELYENELAYTEKVYNQIGWTAGVKRYLAYNANKAMMNLGYPPFIPEEDAKPEAVILSAMSIDANETHDFFSGSGSSYVVGRGEETDDDDWS